MPVWHEATKALRASGRLAVIGVTQEQHPNRCRLFAAWKGIDWPIAWDPFNMTGTRVVPRVTLIDEHGVVRALRAHPRQLAAFVEKTFPKPQAPEPPLPKGEGFELVELLRAKEKTDAWRYYRALSDLLWNVGNGDRAMADLVAGARAHPGDAAAAWRLGVAYRMRHDSGERHDGDFQAAIDHWRRGLVRDERQYIYRRRLQQYGPRLHQPYPFYDWVARAQQALQARGVTPPAMVAALTQTELAAPAASTPGHEPDPKKQIEAPPRLLEVDSAVAWSEGGAKHGPAARVHVVIRPAGNRVLLWDAEAGPVTIWLDLPEGWKASANPIPYVLRGTSRADEEVTIDVEVVATAQASGPATVRGYALYYACLDGPGECRYLRHDFEIPIPKRP